MVEKDKHDDKIKVNLNIEGILQSYSKQQLKNREKLMAIEKNISQQLISKSIP